MLLGLEYVASTLVLFGLNMSTLIKFRQIMCEKRIRIRFSRTSQVINEYHINVKELRFTKLIIVLTSICLFCRVFDLFANIQFRLKLYSVFVSPEAKALTSLIFVASFLFKFSLHAFDLLLYCRYDSNLNELVSSWTRAYRIARHSNVDNTWNINLALFSVVVQSTKLFFYEAKFDQKSNIFGSYFEIKTHT